MEMNAVKPADPNGLNDGSQIVLKKEQSNYIAGKFDPDQYPPKVSLAKQHGLARRVATPRKEENNNNEAVDVCDCCGLVINNEPLPLSSSRLELAFLGPGFPLYFEFIFYCIIMLGILIFVEGIYNFVSNYYGNVCSAAEGAACTFEIINRISLANKSTDHDLFKAQGWVNFAAACILVVSMHIFRKYQRLTLLECDRGLLSPSDYSICISGFPQNEKLTEEKVKNWLEKYWKRMNLTFQEDPKKKESNAVVSQIVIGYDIGEYISLIREKDRLLALKRKSMKEKINEKNVEEKLKATNVKIDKIESDVEKEVEDLNSGIVFITFSTEKIKHEFLDRYSFSYLRNLWIKFKTSFCCGIVNSDELLIYNGKLLSVINAPEPNDVLWENLSFKFWYKLKVRSLIYFVTIVILALCFALILGISFIQNYVNEEAKKNKESSSVKTGVLILGVFSSFVVVFINSCLTIGLKKFGNMERHSTFTYLYISNAIKLGLAQFFNTAIIILIVNIIIQKREELFLPGGIVTDVISIFASNAIVAPLMNFFNPWYLLRIWKRRSIEKYGAKSLVTQQEAHSVYEGGDIDMAARYAGLIKTMWLTGFYVTLTPLGSMISFFGMIIMYWNDKYLLLRRYARPPLFSHELNSEMVELLEYMPFFMGVGSLIFHYILFDPKDLDILPDILTICISGLNFIFPSAKLNKMIFKIDDEMMETDPYEKARSTFATDYDRANPVTREAAMKEWVKFRENKNNVPIPIPAQNSEIIPEKKASQIDRRDSKKNFNLTNLSQYAAEKNTNKISNLYGYTGNYYGQNANQVYQGAPNQYYYQGQPYGNAYGYNYQTALNNQNTNSNQNNNNYNYQGTMINNQNYYDNNNQGNINQNVNNQNNYIQGQIINSEPNQIHSNDDRGIGQVPGEVASHGNIVNNMDPLPPNYGYQLPPQMPGGYYGQPQPRGY